MLRRKTIVYLSIAAASLFALSYRGQKEYRECREYVASHAHHDETQPIATEQATQLTFSIDDLCRSGGGSSLIDRLLGLTLLISIFVSIGLLVQDLIHWLKGRQSFIGPAAKS
jgi:hypothetical protein